MSYWKDVWRIINSGNYTVSRTTDGVRAVDATVGWKEMPIRQRQRIIDTMDNAAKTMTYGKESVISLSDIRREAASNLSLVGGITPKAQVARAKDSVINEDLSIGIYGTDPNMSSVAVPNIWISPGEAITIYGQGGIPKFIIDKKSNPIVQNGMRIRNQKLSREQLDTVNETSIKTGLANAAAQATRYSLTEGGSLLFPFFRYDTPLTMGMSVPDLMKLDIVGKGCIDRYVPLDRWSVVHIPNWNPTASDFLTPMYYFIPWLGTDVSGSRCARIVTSPLPGYWGVVSTLGWGTSDVISWYRSYCNYKQVVSLIPSMIRQMSLLVRTFNVDLSNALNGATSLKDIDEKSTLAIRQASSDNPISMDVIGDLKAIQRDFHEVAALTRLERQDLAADAAIPEEKFWSSERGAFASGDMTDGLNEGEWAGIKHVNTEIEKNLQRVAMLEVINALGKDREIIAALPYTTVEILEPRIENAEKRALVWSDITEGMFKVVAAGGTVDVALDMATQYGDKHLVPSAEVISALKKRQAEVDARDKEDHELEVAMQKQQLENLKNGIAVAGAQPQGKSKDKKGGYTPLEQKKKEKTRGAGARRESVGKAKGKMIQ